MAPITLTLVLSALVAQIAQAHPGHDIRAEAAERAQFLQERQPNSVRSCQSELRRRGHVQASHVRRRKMAQNALVSRGLTKRDFATYNISHASTKDVSYGDDETLLFSDNSSCVLQPEVTQGPYYVDGELIRSDVVEDQAGVPLYMDIQLIDTNTCQPLPSVFVDVWHCNATGVYSGVSAMGNGNQNDTANVDTTFLRGLAQTDVNGVVQFETIFPGHYTGRATHIHVLTHNTNTSTIRTNGTVLQGNNFTAQASHVGQIFFDQDLISRVEALAPYTDNEQELTLNADDGILSTETEDSDPFMEYILLNPDDVSEGVLAWISLGIDPTADDAIASAATYFKGGGVTNPDADSIGRPDDGASPSGAPAASGSAAAA